MAGPVGPRNAAESGNMGFMDRRVREELSQEIQRTNATQHTPDTTRLVTMIALFHLNRSAPAS